MNLQNTGITKAEVGLLSGSEKNDADVFLLDSSDELNESVSESERGKAENAKNKETEAVEPPHKKTKPGPVTPETVDNVPSVSQCENAKYSRSEDIDAACNGIEHNVEKKVQAMDGIQKSADVFELMKENEHLFDSDKPSNRPEHDTQQFEEVQTLTGNIKQDADNSIQRKECINVDCNEHESNVMFYHAPDFVINHFHLKSKKRNKQMFVCDICFDLCIKKYGTLCASLQDKQPLLLENINKYSGSVELIDSSDEEDEMDTKSDSNQIQGKFDANTLNLLENSLEDIIRGKILNAELISRFGLI